MESRSRVSDAIRVAPEITSQRGTWRLLWGLMASLFLVACAAEEPSAGEIVQTFRTNQPAFSDAVTFVQSLALPAERTEIRPEDVAASDPRIANVFSMRPFNVQEIVVYASDGAAWQVEFEMYSVGLSISGRSWVIVHRDGAWKPHGDPAIKYFDTCDDADIKKTVEQDSLVLSAECRLAPHWTLEYSAN